MSYVTLSLLALAGDLALALLIAAFIRAGRGERGVEPALHHRPVTARRDLPPLPDSQR